MQITTIQSKTYFCSTHKTTLNTLFELADKEVDKLYSEVKQLNLKQEGPIEFIYLDVSQDKDKTFTLLIAMPVEKVTIPGNGPFSIINRNTFKCVKYIHKGSFRNMDPVYGSLFQQMAEKGIKPSNEIREVYEKFVDVDSPENITEIEVGIL